MTKITSFGNDVHSHLFLDPFEMKHPTARIVEKKDDSCRGPRRGPLPHRVVAAQRLPGCLAGNPKENLHSKPLPPCRNLWEFMGILKKTYTPSRYPRAGIYGNLWES